MVLQLSYVESRFYRKSHTSYLLNIRLALLPPCTNKMPHFDSLFSTLHHNINHHLFSLLQFISTIWFQKWRYHLQNPSHNYTFLTLNELHLNLINRFKSHMIFYECRNLESPRSKFEQTVMGAFRRSKKLCMASKVSNN